MPDNLLFKSATSTPVGKGTVAVVAALLNVFWIDGVKVGGSDGTPPVSYDVLPGGTDDTPSVAFTAFPGTGISSSFVNFLDLDFFGVAFPPTFSGERV